MGLTLSKPKNENNLRYFIDEVASKYILTQNFDDLIKLNEDSYCDNLILITSEILYTQLSLQEVEYLNNQLNGKNKQSEKVALLHKKNLENYDVQEPKKKLLCKALSEFYIKVSNIFSAIQVTLNGEKYDSNLNNIEQKENIKDANSCINKINKLVETVDLAHNYPSNELVIKPYICDDNELIQQTNLNPLTLFDENGIKELNKLYESESIEYNELMKNEYEKDVEIFYKLINDKSIPIENGDKIVKTFEDIQIENINVFCNENLIEKNKKINVNKKDKIIKKYIQHIKNMINNIVKIKIELLKILQKIFVFKVYTLKDGEKSKTITINPELTFSELNKLNIKTKNTLIDYYKICHKDFETGKKMLLAIIKQYEIKQSLIQLDQIKSYENGEDETEEEVDETKEDVDETQTNIITEPMIDTTTTQSNNLTEQTYTENEDEEKNENINTELTNNTIQSNI